MLTKKSLVALALLVILAACRQQEAQVSQEPATAPVASPASTTPAGAVVIEISADDERMRAAGTSEKLPGRVIAKGAAGVLVFGPYISMVPGKYSLLIEGSSSSAFVVDVAHAGGTKRLAVKQFTGQSGNAAGQGSLAALDFDLAEPVQNAEFRVIVPDTADTSVTSYRVVTR